MAHGYISPLTPSPSLPRGEGDNAQLFNLSTFQPYKYRIKLTKKGILRYFSHLDWQNTFLKFTTQHKLTVRGQT